MAPVLLFFEISAANIGPKLLPPKPNCFMTYIDTPLLKKVSYIAKRKWKPNIQHYSKADNLWACFKIAEWGVFCHLRTLQTHPARSTKFNLTVPNLQLLTDKISGASMVGRYPLSVSLDPLTPFCNVITRLKY